jgi:hypothetical protein
VACFDLSSGYFDHHRPSADFRFWRILLQKSFLVMNGGGLSLQRRDETIALILDQVVAELRSSQPDTTINTT